MTRGARIALAALLPACSGTQSALAPAGEQASQLASLFWWLTAACLAIWVGVIALALYAAWSRERESLVGARRLIWIGGVIAPTLLLTGLLCYGLALLPQHLAAAQPGSLRIAVTGAQYWWRVRYLPRSSWGPLVSAAPAELQAVELANEIRLPVNEEVELVLESHDVIHSFWIPSLAGKVDMIPGRQTRLRLRPTRTGTFRGACAEYCGASHAWMSFAVLVQERADFDRWLAQQAAPARVPEEALARDGQRVFASNGCGACHSVRGSAASGVVGPDLTHVGGRASLGAGILPNQPADFGRWVAETDVLKPGVHMPAFGMLEAPELRALATYLEALQ